MKNNPQYTDEFLQSLLLPEKLKADFIKKENNIVQQVRQTHGKDKCEEETKKAKVLHTSLVRQESKYAGILRGTTMLTDAFYRSQARNAKV